MKRIDFNEFMFECTGREMSAHAGIIGIQDDDRESSDVERLKTYDGYDGTIGQYSEKFTVEERHELADYMIGLWTRYREAI